MSNKPIKTYADLADAAQHWQVKSLQTPAGNTVRFNFWEVSKPRGHVLVVPGRNEHPLKYTELASEWGQRGMQVYCLDPDPDVVSFQPYLNQFNSAFTIFGRQVGKEFALVQGHSTGAHVAARCLATGEESVPPAAGLIMSAPLAGMNYGEIPSKIAQTITKIMGRIVPEKKAQGDYDPQQQTFEKNPVTSDPARFSMMSDVYRHHPEMAPRGAKWGWVQAAQESCTQLAAEADKLRLPHLLLAMPNDKVVSPAAQGMFKRAERVDFPQSRHEVFMERDSIRGDAWAAVDSFVARLRANVLRPAAAA